MKAEEVLKLNLGDIIYECEYGVTIATRVVEKPQLIDDQIKWTGKSLKTGELVNYEITQGLEHYAKLYTEPQYIIKKEDGKYYLDDGLEGIKIDK